MEVIITKNLHGDNCYMFVEDGAIVSAPTCCFISRKNLIPSGRPFLDVTRSIEAAIYLDEKGINFFRQTASRYVRAEEDPTRYAHNWNLGRF